LENPEGKVFQAIFKALRENCPEFAKFPTRACLEKCGLFDVCATIKNFAVIRGKR